MTHYGQDVWNAKLRNSIKKIKDEQQFRCKDIEIRPNNLNAKKSYKIIT